MNATRVPLEKIPLRLPDVELHQTDSDVKLVRVADKHSTTFPEASLYYLEHFVKGHSIYDIILESYTKGRKVDFKTLKQTLLTLYWSKNILNGAQFAPAIENTDWLAVNQMRLFNPLTEMEVSGFGAQLFATLAFTGLSIVSAMILLGKDPSVFALLLFPQAFLSMKGVLSSYVSHFFNTSRPLSIHTGFFGFYLRESSTKRTALSTPEFVTHTAVTLGLFAGSLIFWRQVQTPLMTQIGSTVSLLLTCLLLSPSHKTDLSDYYLTVEKEKKATMWPMLSVTLFLAFSLWFFGELALNILSALKTWENIFILPYLTLFALATFFFMDLIDDFEFITSQLPQLLRKPKQRAAKDLPSVLKTIPMFETLPSKVIEDMAQASQVLKVKPGTYICHEGDMTTEMYVVVNGRVGIYKNQPDGSSLCLMQLSQDSVFGEGAFFLNRPRGSDVVALEPTTLIKIHRPASLNTDYKIPVPSSGQFQMKIWALQALINSKLFKEIPTEIAMQMVGAGEVKEVKSGTTVIKKGDMPDSIWILIEGSARAHMGGGEVRDMGSGDVFGEIGIIWNTRRTSTVGTTRDSILLRIDARNVWPLFAANLNLGVTLQQLGEVRLSEAA